MNMTGEYWIHEDGHVDFADGDAGDTNHEMIVVGIVQREISDALAGETGPNGSMKRSYDNYEYVDWDEFLKDLADTFGNENHQLIALKQAGITDEQWAVANGFMDAREYAVKDWGWKRIRGHHLETWTFTKQDMEAIITGVENILDEQGIEEDEFGDAAIDLYITVYSTGQHFDTTLKELKDRLKPQTTTPAQQQLQQTSREKEQYYKWMANNASQQVKDLDYQNINQVYKRPGTNPFGDSIMGFKVWLNEHMDRYTQ